MGTPRGRRVPVLTRCKASRTLLGGRGGGGGGGAVTFDVDEMQGIMCVVVLGVGHG